MIRRISLLALTIVAFGRPVLAQEPQIRVHFDKIAECWIGESKALVVELLAPGYFDGAPSFHLPDPGGILTMPPTSSPTLSTEDIAGVSYTVQRYELAVVSRRGGDQTIPTFEVSIRFKRQPLDKVSQSAVLKSEAVPFKVNTPPGAESLGRIISARNLKVTESWTPNSTTAKMGDAFVRTINFSAPNVPAMIFTPFPAAPVDGLGIYRKSPVVQDHSERGESTGQRRDVISYVCERPGTFVVPPTKLSWFDLDAQKIKTIEFPAKTVSVVATSAAEAREHLKPDRLTSYQITLGLFLFIVAATTIILIIRLLWKQNWDSLQPRHLSLLNPPNQDSAKPSRIAANLVATKSTLS